MIFHLIQNENSFKLPKSYQKILPSKSQCCRSMLVITANNCFTILQISTWEQQIYVLSTSGKQQQQIKLKYNKGLEAGA